MCIAHGTARQIRPPGNSNIQCPTFLIFDTCYNAVNALYLSVTDTYSQGEHGRVAAVPRTSVNVNVYNRQKPAWGGSAARWAVGVDVRSRSALKKSGHGKGTTHVGLEPTTPGWPAQT